MRPVVAVRLVLRPRPARRPRRRPRPRAALAAALALALAAGCGADPEDEPPELGGGAEALLGPPSPNDQCKTVAWCLGNLCLTLGNKVDGTACTDQSACTTTDACQAGVCVPGPSPACDDGNLCTDDVCNPAVGCVAVANQAACDDGDGCTTGDTCSGGACGAGAPVVCAPTDDCHAAGTCNPADGKCSNPVVADGSACGAGCGQCEGGACGAMLVAEGPEGRPVSGLAVDATSVYWGDGLYDPDPPHWIRKAPKGGGEVTELIDDSAVALVVDGDRVFYASGHTGILSVSSAPLAGGAPRVVATIVGPTSVATDADRVYFADPFAAVVGSVAKAGGPVTIYADGQFDPDSVVVTSTHLYWTAAGVVRGVALGGGPVLDLVTGQDGPSGLAVDDTSLYWTTGPGGQVKRAPRTGGPEVVLADGLEEPAAITLDDANVYWLDHHGGLGTTVGATSKLGGEPVVVATGGAGAPINDGLVVDGACVYWSAGAIYRAPR